MKTEMHFSLTALDAYFLRVKAQERLVVLEDALVDADAREGEVWDWYESLTEEDYWATAAEADRLTHEATENRKRLEALVEETKHLVQALTKAESALEYLESEGESYK